MIAGITASVRRLQSGGGDDLPSEIGQPFGGGFYAGDFEYPDGRWFKLIVSGANDELTNTAWKTTNSSTVDTDSEYDGWANTQAMILAGAHLHPAANFASIINEESSINDWYLPAKDEMALICQNLRRSSPTAPPNFQSGGSEAFHQNDYYWTSTQHSTAHAWQQSFYVDGDQAYNAKDSGRRVRLIRRIPFTP